MWNLISNFGQKINFSCLPSIKLECEKSDGSAVNFFAKSTENRGFDRIMNYVSLT